MKLAIPRNIKPNKTWIVLGIALGIGLLAALAARSYLSSQMAAIEARSKSGQVSLVVATRELKKGERISSDNVAVRSIPADYAHSGAVLPDEFDRLDGLALAFPVRPGEMILWSLVETRKPPTFSARIESGRRAITVPVDEINSISGMLEPGDMVDLMVTLDRNGKTITFPFMQSVQVMATGQRSVDDPKSGERRQYSTVTLDMSPEQAQNLIVAREAGKITALLRNPQDKQIFGNNGIDAAALLGLKGDNQALMGAEDKQVPVLYGGRGAKFPSEALTLGQYTRPVGAVSSKTALQVSPQPSAQDVSGPMATPATAMKAAINNIGGSQP